MLDVILLVILGVVTWCVASEGALGAGMTLLSVVFGGLLAMNFFEPLAGFLENTLSMGPTWTYRWDFIALMGLFILFTFLLRLLTDHLSPTFIQMQRLAYDIGRWSCAFLTGYVTIAILLTALHTAPLPRRVDSSSVQEFAGFKAEGANFFGLSPDKQWLGFTQWVTSKSLSRNRPFDAPHYVMGDHKGEDEKNPGEIWPSFPIRYATRREQRFTSSGGSVASSAGGPTPLRRIGGKPDESEGEGDRPSNGAPQRSSGQPDSEF